MKEEELYDFPVANLQPYYKPPIIPSLRNHILGLMAVTCMASEHAQYYILLADKTGRTAIDLFTEDCAYGRLPPTPSRSDFVEKALLAEQKARRKRTSINTSTTQKEQPGEFDIFR